MKVLLISANPLTDPYPVYPLGLDYLAHTVSKRHTVRIVDTHVVGDTKGILHEVRQFAPDIIGLSIRNVDNTDVTAAQDFMDIYQDLIRSVKNAFNIPILLGGSGFTLFPSVMMRTLQADYGLIGEGERLGHFLDALENNRDVSEVPGAVTRNSTAEIPPPWDKEIRRLFDSRAPHLPFYLDKGGMLNLQSKRGCPFRCIYCTYPHIEGQTLRLIPPERVAETAIQLQDAGARYLYITDSVFNADYQHSAQVAREFIRAGLKIPWGAFFSPTSPPAGYFELLAEAGLKHVEFGTDSLSDRMLANYGKPFRSRHVARAHETAISAGLYTAHYLLLGGPGEDAATLEETLDQLDKLNQAVVFFYCGIRIYPNTLLYHWSVEEGQITPQQDLLSPTFYQSPSIKSSDIVARVREKSRGRPNWLISTGGEETAQILSRMYEKGYTGPLWEYLLR
jgi:radical SAM superfamily enzyme YgiQ (UPF0313 family)